MHIFLCNHVKFTLALVYKVKSSPISSCTQFVYSSPYEHTCMCAKVCIHIPLYNYLKFMLAHMQSYVFVNIQL